MLRKFDLKPPLFTAHDDTKFQSIYEINENFQAVEVRSENEHGFQISLANEKNHGQYAYCPMWGFVFIVDLDQEEVRLAVSPCFSICNTLPS